MRLLGETTVLFGCGGHSRSVADVLLAKDPGALLIFVDDRARDSEQIYDFDVRREFSLKNERVFLAIGNNILRKRKFEEIKEKNLISIISNSAHRGYRSIIGKGCFVGNLCHIGPEAIIGVNTILNTASVIEHEVKVGSHCHIGPSATISGRCTIGDLVFIGVGATIRDKISICPNVLVGAGATVVADITEPGTYVGTPARRIR